MAESKRKLKRKGSSLGELFMSWRREENPVTKASLAMAIASRLDRIEEAFDQISIKSATKRSDTDTTSRGQPGLGGPVERIGARLSDANEVEISRIRSKTLIGRSAVIRAAVEDLIATVGGDYSSLVADESNAPHPVVAVLKVDEADALRRISDSTGISMSSLIRVAVSAYATKLLNPEKSWVW